MQGIRKYFCGDSACPPNPTESTQRRIEQRREIEAKHREPQTDRDVRGSAAGTRFHRRA